METHCKLYAGATGAGTVSSFPLMLVVADPPPPKKNLFIRVVGWLSAVLVLILRYGGA